MKPITKCRLLLPVCAVLSVAQTPTSTVVTAFESPTASLPLTITAAVTPDPGTGYVAFVDGFRPLGTAPLINGQARLVTSFITGGSHSLKAIFRGDAAHLASSSADLTMNVRAAEPASTGLARQFESDTEPFFVDVNDDGRVDLVRTVDSFVIVESLQSDGTYDAPVSYNIGGNRRAVGVADFNNDGAVDVAAIDQANLLTLSGDGFGGFGRNILRSTPLAIPPASFGWFPRLTGDFNRDGAVDLALVAASWSTLYGPALSVQFGDGNGGFSQAGFGYDPIGDVGDVNGDGVLDFAREIWLRGTSLFYRVGCQLFISGAQGYINGDDCGATTVTAMKVGDINSDGKPDLVFNSDRRLGSGPGAFASPAPIDFGGPFTLLDLLDYNSDGHLDAIGDSLGRLAVRLGNGTGAFPGSLALTADAASFRRFQDINGDGVLDLIYTDHVLYGSAGKAPVVEAGDSSPNDSKDEEPNPETVSNVPVAPAYPAVVDLLPKTGSGLSVTLTGRFAHPNGIGSHYLAYILILPTPNIVQFTAQGSCLVEYNRISNGVRLINDAGDNWLGPLSGVPITPFAGTLSNSRCSVDVSRVGISMSGPILSFTAPIQLKPQMGPDLATFIQAQDVTGKWTGMNQFGNWQIPNASQVAQGPRIVSFSRAAIDANTVRVNIAYTHTTSLSRMSLIHLRIAERIVTSQYCHVLYSPALRAINLIDDTGTALLGWRTANTGALTNNRCSAQSHDLVSEATNGSASVSFTVQRNPQTLNGDLRFYVNAFDTDARLTHWVDGGFWQ